MVAVNIRQWLVTLGMPQYADAFESNDIDADLLARLDDNILKDIGIASAGHRLRILAAIAQIRSDTDKFPNEPALIETRSGIPSLAAGGDRRQATILVADISGYTALCARLDAEEVQVILGEFYNITDALIASYGGYVIDHAGDSTIAAFGAPIAHGNDSERATRAALAMHAKAAAIRDPSGEALALHIGIASGEVVAATITGGLHPKYSITGEAVNLAARAN